MDLYYYDVYLIVLGGIDMSTCTSSLLSLDPATERKKTFKKSESYRTITYG